MKIKLMIDTSVWLDMVKDYRQQPVIEALEGLIHSGAVELLIPEIIIEEFHRNKKRVAADAARSLQSHFAVVRDAVIRFGDRQECSALLSGIDGADYAAVIKGEAVNASLEKIDELLKSAEPLPASDAVKARVADRALGKRAPFHKSKNSAADALIIETYAEHLGLAGNSTYRFAFVSHNKLDFSQEVGDARIAHPDLNPIFASLRSTYWTSLADLIDDIDPDILANLDLEFINGTPQPRRLSEISGEIDLLFKQIWYNRHQCLKIDIEEGRHFVVPEADYARSPYRSDQTVDFVWAQARAAARKTEEHVGLENLGPWDDFEWGMINGKLSALRWILGYEWDMLDT